LQKYSNAKSISSDQYFNRQQGPPVDPEIQRRLASRQGATAISSADLFGGEQEETYDGKSNAFCLH
tara:strand:+ start:240 stop:437 length:198 start_codon:yes stop_codon:yes gene_type:complete